MGIRSKETYWRLHMGGRESREEERGKKEIGLVVSEWVDEWMPHIDVDPRVVLTLMSSSGVQRWRLVGRPFNEVLGELSLMSLTVLPVWSADMLLLLSFLLGKLGWRKKKKTGPCWGYRCMNQWVATKKWLLFMNLGPVVFVSNREVKRLATMFYSRSTNSQFWLGWELRLKKASPFSIRAPQCPL